MSMFFNKLFLSGENCIDVTRLFVKLLGVNATSNTIDRDIRNHPHFPSLLAVSDLLLSIGIENLAATFPKEKLLQIPPPFIAQIHSDMEKSQYFTIVKAIEREFVVVLNTEKYIWERKDHKTFLSTCSGVALLAEVGEDAGEVNYAYTKKKSLANRVLKYSAISILPVLVLFSIVVGFSRVGIWGSGPLLYLFLNLVGASATALLLLFEFNEANPLLNEFCASGKRINCSAVLKSKGANVFGFSWAQIGLAYFLGCLMFQVTAGLFNPDILGALAVISCLAGPYILFSLYYQWRVVKQWCSICLAVQVLLAAELGISLADRQFSFLAITSSSVVAACLSLSVAFIAVSIVAYLMRHLKKSEVTIHELQRLKNNDEFFFSVLSRQRALEVEPVGLGIILGNKNAANKLVKVCNPYCGPCAKMHVEIEDLLHNQGNLQVQIVFTATNEEGDKRAAPVRHLLALAANRDESVVKTALNDWYTAKSKNYEAFAEKYPLNGELNLQNERIRAMSDWCKEINIAYTPTVFLNGRQLPNMYSIADLKHLLNQSDEE